MLKKLPSGVERWLRTNTFLKQKLKQLAEKAAPCLPPYEEQVENQLGSAATRRAQPQTPVTLGSELLAPGGAANIKKNEEKIRKSKKNSNRN